MLIYELSIVLESGGFLRINFQEIVMKNLSREEPDIIMRFLLGGAEHVCI
jgi:hypothetical protein